MVVLILIFLLILHLLEEIKTDFRKRLPIGEMPGTVFIVANILIYGFCAATLWSVINNYGSAELLVWIFVLATLGNGLGHISMMVVRRGYFPGGITAIPILLFSI
jgi:hypothetical protein